MPGVLVHANIASQLVQTALTGRSGLTGFTGWQQQLWIVFLDSVRHGRQLDNSLSRLSRKNFSFSFFEGLSSKACWQAQR